MTDRLTIALAQFNPTVGDLEGNLALLRRARDKAGDADLVVATELAVTGYPPEDLVLKPAFLDAAEAAVRKLAADTAKGGPAMLIGAPWRVRPRDTSGVAPGTYNAALLLDGGEIVAQRFKHDLPNYGVFDEKRVFTAGPLPGPVNFRDVRLGVLVCEDMWREEVPECLAESGAEILVVLNGSPYEMDKSGRRLSLAVARVVETGLPLIYVNQVGGQDELVFDGASFVLNADRSLAVRAPCWTPSLTRTRWARGAGGLWGAVPGGMAPEKPRIDDIYHALTLSLRDYVGKNGFPGVLIGLSGGIDSALTAAVAADALGPERVRAVMMPSPYTSEESLVDARACATSLGIRYDTVSIEPAMNAFARMLGPLFEGRAPDTTEENIQARARGIALMGLSNKFGSMVVSTGNKSEMSVGYATLYGDMAGGFALLKDVYKTTVYELCRWRNAHVPDGGLGPAGPVVPERIFTKPPSAELKPGQKDQDSLPPYDVLDAILGDLIEGDLGVEDIVAKGHDRATVLRVWKMLENAEYKRRQAPPGCKVTSRSFGRDRRYPVTNAFKGPA